MSFVKLSRPPEDVDAPRSHSASPVRPQFNSHITSDRLREGSVLRQPPFKMGSNIRKGRRSIFKEHGLDDELISGSPSASSPSPQSRDISEREFGEITGLRSDSHPDEPEREREQDKKEDKKDRSPERPHRRQTPLSSRPWYARLANPRGRPRIKSTSSAPPGTVSGLQRFTLIALLIAVVFPALSWRNGRTIIEINGADAGIIRPREDSPTGVCTRWAHQDALLNGTLYIYGGRAKKEGGQTQNTWNNYFLTLDLSKSWETSSPALKGLSRPDGPPAVSMGYLWHDYNNLYLYGGQFSDSPYVDPAPESLWRYSISDKKWTELPDPRTSEGNYSEPSDQPVHRAAEGAGISVPELGLSWYFGGHLDWATTPGWSKDTDRVYLKSLIEFTHPNYMNTGVKKLSDGTGAPEGGALRNITKAGVQANEFPERADGVLVFVPGWGGMGVLIGMAGGTADTFTDDLRKLDVYDIANSKWFHQETSGEAPSTRVNPCAVVASAPDASSFQVYMFGGQNLQPYGDQEQHDDMYILTIPSFTWIKVDKGKGTPYPRAGHTCKMYDGQMIVVGGYVGKDIECDSPGIYVFDASSLEWRDGFRAGDHEPDSHPDNFVLAGSYGYSVPKAVQEVIGGGESGGATASTPASGPATGGPFATGKPPVFTITESGATATITQTTGQTGTSPGPPEDGSPSDDGDDDNGKPKGSGDVNPGLVAAGVIAGITGALACYLGFCAWLYRRQVRAYKQHLAVANRYSGASSNSLDSAGLLFGRRSRHHTRIPSQHSTDEDFGWVGSEREPPWLPEPKGPFDDPSPGSGTGTGSGYVSAAKRSEDTRPETSGSGGSTEGLLDGQEPSFFSVVMGPRRALRVVNGAEQI